MLVSGLRLSVLRLVKSWNLVVGSDVGMRKAPWWGLWGLAVAAAAYGVPVP